MLFSQTIIGVVISSCLCHVQCPVYLVLHSCTCKNIQQKSLMQRDSLPELGVSCIHFLNVVSRIWTSTEERSHCCISSNTWNASSSSSTPRWRQMGLRDRSTLRESRVVSASSTHFSHHALGIGSSIVERSNCLTETKQKKRREEGFGLLVGWFGFWLLHRHRLSHWLVGTIWRGTWTVFLTSSCF